MKSKLHADLSTTCQGLSDKVAFVLERSRLQEGRITKAEEQVHVVARGALPVYFLQLGLRDAYLFTGILTLIQAETDSTKLLWSRAKKSMTTVKVPVSVCSFGVYLPVHRIYASSAIKDLAARIAGQRNILDQVPAAAVAATVFLLNALS